MVWMPAALDVRKSQRKHLATGRRLVGSAPEHLLLASPRDDALFAPPSGLQVEAASGVVAPDRTMRVRMASMGDSSVNVVVLAFGVAIAGAIMVLLLGGDLLAVGLVVGGTAVVAVALSFAGIESSMPRGLLFLFGAILGLPATVGAAYAIDWEPPLAIVINAFLIMGISGVGGTIVLVAD